MALAAPAALAASTAAPAAGTTYYSESVGVKTPNEHITGSTSSRDAQGAPLKDEQALLDKVMTALVGDEKLKGADIHVNVEKDRVVLSGKAKDAAQADHARQVAQNAATGATVESQLTS
jgi:osmotically-inducible protein OsmY